MHLVTHNYMIIATLELGAACSLSFCLRVSPGIVSKPTMSDLCWPHQAACVIGRPADLLELHFACLMCACVPLVLDWVRATQGVHAPCHRHLKPLARWESDHELIHKPVVSGCIQSTSTEPMQHHRPNSLNHAANPALSKKNHAALYRVDAQACLCMDRTPPWMN